MPEKAMADYLSPVTADYTLATFQVTPQQILIEMGEKNQEVHNFDDGSERVITLDDASIFHVRLRWTTGITKADAGTVVDFYHDPAKANGMARSIYWEHPTDGYTYTVKFRSTLPRELRSGMVTHHTIAEMTLKVLGIAP